MPNDLYGAAMVAGMATCSPTPDGNGMLGHSRAEWFDALWNKILHKDSWRVEQMWEGDPEGLRRFGMVYDTEHGDSYYTIHEFNPAECGNFYDHATGEPVYTYPNREMVRQYLRYVFGDGVPCTCGICNAGGDCCGNWFVQGIDIWPADLNDGRWYVKVHSYRNV